MRGKRAENPLEQATLLCCGMPSLGVREGEENDEKLSNDLHGSFCRVLNPYNDGM